MVRPAISGRRRVLLRATAASLAFAGLGAFGAGTSPAYAAGSAAPRHLHQWWYDAMQLDQAHRISTGKGAVVAVIDGHLDPSVPDLKGADISLRTDCQGNKALVLHDRSADHATSMTTAIVGQGTGNGAGGRGVLGVAPDAQLRFYSVDPDPNSQVAYECQVSEVGDLVLKAARQGADVISMSFGGIGTGMEPWIKKANALGAVVVAATGQRQRPFSNGSAIDFPAQERGVVGVYAVGSNGGSWLFNPRSNAQFHSYAAISAPGIETELGGYRVTNQWVSGDPRTGTSGATALTAGVFALLKARWPEATGNQLVQDVIHHSYSAKNGNLRWSQNYGYGTIDPLAALKVDPTKYPDENPLVLTPAQAEAKYPASSYGAAASSSSPSPSSAASSPSKGATKASDSSSGTPGWVLPVAVVVVLLLAAGGALAMRRRSSTPPDDVPTDITPTHASTSTGAGASSRPEGN